MRPISSLFIICALLVSCSPALLGDSHDDLHSDEPKRRAKAAEELGKQGNSSDLPALGALLKDPERQVRAEAAAAIVAIGTRDSLPLLIEATRDPEPSIQILAADGLVNFYYPGYVQTGWTAALKRFGTSLKGRFTEINTLMIDPYITVSPDVIAAISRVATGGASMEARALACRDLGILRARPAVPQLLEALRTKDTQVIFESLRAIEKIGDHSAGPQFSFLLRDLNEQVQVAAIDATGQLLNRGAVPELKDILQKTGKAQVRRAALEALSKMADSSTRDLFLKYLGDRDKYLRAAAAEGIGRSGNRSDIDALKKALDEENSESPRLSIAFGLVKLGELNYLPYLMDGLNSSFHRDEARPFLVELARQPEVLAALYDPLKNGSIDQRKNLADVIAVSGNAESISRLEELTHDPNPEVAQEALRASKILKGRI